MAVTHSGPMNVAFPAIPTLANYGRKDHSNIEKNRVTPYLATLANYVATYGTSILGQILHSWPSYLATLANYGECVAIYILTSIYSP